jgi:hypothetical protein
MYSVAATYLSQADDLPLVGEVGAVGSWIVFAVCVVVLAAMVLTALRIGVGRLGGYTGRRSDLSAY